MPLHGNRQVSMLIWSDVVLYVSMASIPSGTSAIVGDKTWLNCFSSIMLILTWQWKWNTYYIINLLITQTQNICGRIVFPCLIQNDFGDTALVGAVDKGHLHVAEILVKNRADMNYRNKMRALIPITQACIMWPMIRHGIMVNQCDVQGMSNKHACSMCCS